MGHCPLPRPLPQWGVRGGTSYPYRTPLCAFMTTGLDRTYHAHRFILVSHFNFLFVPCGGLSWLPVSFLLHVKYTLPYRIVFGASPLGAFGTCPAPLAES